MPATATKIHTFFSRNQSLRLVWGKSRPEYNNLGELFRVHPGVTLEFQEGQLVVEEGGANWHLLPLDPNMPDSPVVNTVEWLRQHPLKDKTGRDYSFHEHGNEPGRVPDPTSLLREIVKAAGTMDLETLEFIQAEEQKDWQRGTVLEAVEEAIEIVRSLIAQQDAQSPVEPVTPVKSTKAARTAENGS